VRSAALVVATPPAGKPADAAPSVERAPKKAARKTPKPKTTRAAKTSKAPKAAARKKAKG
jgi:hypothetical protein